MSTLLIFLLVLVVGQILVAILGKRFVPGFKLTEAYKKIWQAFRSLLTDGKELLLFAAFEIAAIAALALVLAIFGPKVSVILLLASVCLFALWATKPPAKPR